MRLLKKLRKSDENVKVKNATPNIYDGIKFRSLLETYTYKLLKERGISALYETVQFTMVPKFEYLGEKVRAMTIRPDFVGEDFIIECKGSATDAFPLRWKLLKYSLMQENKNYKLYLVHNLKEVNSAIDELVQKQALCQNLSEKVIELS